MERETDGINQDSHKFLHKKVPEKMNLFIF